MLRHQYTGKILIVARYHAWDAEEVDEPTDNEKTTRAPKSELHSDFSHVQIVPPEQ